MIRRATPDDLHDLVQLGNEFWDQTRYAHAGIPYGKDMTTQTFAALIDSGIVQLAEDNGDIVGFIMLAIYLLPFAQDIKMAGEMVFYVAPAHRKTGLGKRLIKQAEHVAKQQGCRYFSMVNLEEVSPEQSARLYQSVGLELVETSYSKEI